MVPEDAHEIATKVPPAGTGVDTVYPSFAFENWGNEPLNHTNVHGYRGK